MTVLVVYVMTGSATEAETIARAAVEAGLAACANILAPCVSVYRWQGRVEQGGEVPLILKTTRAHWPGLEALVREKHSYDCPCIIAWDIAAGHAPYLDWVKGAVKSA